MLNGNSGDVFATMYAPTLAHTRTRPISPQCILSPPHRASEHEKRRSALEGYFQENQIEYRLNNFLNEMVAARPAQPINWLANRMRRGDSKCGVPVNTVPLLDSKLGNVAVGSEIEKAWAYSIGMGGGEMPSSGGAGAAAKPTGLTLSIEPLGGNVLLAIRSL